MSKSLDDMLSGLSAEEIDARSIAELDAGRLPLRAQQRLATMRADAAFTSSLSVDEHHAIRSVGFSPVGQVMGAAVVHPGAYGFGNCGYYGYGMFLSSPVPGHVVWSHGGAFSWGSATAMTLIPDANVGIVVLVNATPNGVADAITAKGGKADIAGLDVGDAAACEKAITDLVAKHGGRCAQMPPAGRSPGVQNGRRPVQISAYIRQSPARL